MFSRVQRRNFVGALVTTLALAACAASPATEPAPTLSLEPLASERQPSVAPSSSESLEPSASASTSASSAASEEAAGLAIPLQFPCEAIDQATVEVLIGGAIGQQREWEPGEQPFGEDQPPSQNYGCQYVSAVVSDAGAAPEFGLSMSGEELTSEEWQERIGDSGNCEELEAPAAIVGDEVKAVACPTSVDGWSSVALSGLFGGTGLMCSVFVPDDRIDGDFAAALVEECGRVILELATS